MGTKEKLLALLLDSKGKYLSGEQLANKLNISRTSVWKGIKSLQSQGYDIQASTNRGYILSTDSDIVSIESIKKYLNKRLDFIEINTVSSIDSTNSFVRQKALDGALEGFLMVSEEQTGGRGRKGRSFFSPSDSGIYFSLLLRPHMYDVEKASTITTIAAVSVCEAIEKLTNKSPRIKWVNDVFLDDKKVCGILTEASYDLETHFCDFAVLGIGINVYFPDGGFPDEIKDIATAILDERVPDGKSRIVAETINSFFNFYFSESPGSYVTSYKQKCFILGKKIKIITPSDTKEAIAVDLDDLCHLIVEYPDGSRETLSSGEISVRI